MIYCRFYIKFVVMNGTLTIEKAILDYASNAENFRFNQIIEHLGINRNSARQYLSKLSKLNKLDRIGNGEYRLHSKQSFYYEPLELAVNINSSVKQYFPFADFCIYEGSIFSPLYHNIAINNAIYVETNRDVVEAAFHKLQGSGLPVFKKPDSDFMADYVNLKDPCIIVKPLVTEAPVTTNKDMTVPTIEKLLVDILKDKDLYYMQGYEYLRILDNAMSLFNINFSSLLRYSRRRGCDKELKNCIELVKTGYYD